MWIKQFISSEWSSCLPREREQCGKEEWSSLSVHSLQITMQWHFHEIFSPFKHLSTHAHTWASAVIRDISAEPRMWQKGSRAVLWLEVICVAHTKQCPAKAWLIFLEYSLSLGPLLTCSYDIKRPWAGPKGSSKQLFLLHSWVLLWVRAGLLMQQ